MSVLPVLGKLYSILKYDLVPKNCLNLGKLDYSLHIYVHTYRMCSSNPGSL